MTRRELLAGASLASSAAGASPNAPAAKPFLAFHYQASFDQRALAWYTRFEHLVTGAILDPKTSTSLRRHGSRLIAYEWSSGFYTGDAVSAPLDWQEPVTAKRSDWLLTAKPITGAAAENGRVAEWYDFADPDLRKARARFLAARLVEAGYDGYFFDTVGAEQIPEPAKKAFAARHPTLDYNVCQGEFFKELRAAMPAGKIIFLNQGFRHADALLPYADFDLSESYFTYIAGPKTALRPWDDKAKPWEAIKTPLEQLILPAARKYPNLRFVHVNYAAAGAPLTSNAALHGYVGGKLFGHDAYLIVPGSPAEEESGVYSSGLGRPKGELVERIDLVAREFEFAVIGFRIAAGAKQFRGVSLPSSLGAFIAWKH